MAFPVYVHLLGYRIHPHPFFETIAYLVSARLFFWMRKKESAPAIPLDVSLWILGGSIAGALFGSKVLAWLEAPAAYWKDTGEFAGWENGKTIVGGILGGWLGVEFVKKQLGFRAATGDTFVFPLLLGTALGRIGCFLTGLSDRTHGVACALPWCVDYGDGIQRHPTQLYEIAFLLLYGACLVWRMKRPFPPGYLFRLFVFAYMLYRFCIEFIRPRDILFLGLSPIQWGCLAGAAWAFVSLNNVLVIAVEKKNSE